MKKPGKIIQVEKVRVGGKTYELKIRLIDRGLSHTTRFTYCVTHDDPPIEVRRDEANQCLREAEDELRKALEVEWKPAIAIFAESGDDTTYHGTGQTMFAGRMSIRYARVEVAKRQDGTNLWRSAEADSGFIYNRDATDGVPPGATAVIPDTPENRAKLKVISDGLEKLGANLTLLLGQDRIVKTLQDVRTLQLPAPSAQPKRVTRKKP